MSRPCEFDREKAADAAMNLFLAKGYEATSIEDLTAALGISRASLYNSFGDKHGLLMEAFSRAEQEGCALQSQALAAPGPVRDVIRSFYKSLVESHLRRRKGRGCFFLTLGAELASGDAVIRERVHRNLDRTCSLFLEVAEERASLRRICHLRSTHGGRGGPARVDGEHSHPGPRATRIVTFSTQWSSHAVVRARRMTFLNPILDSSV